LPCALCGKAGGRGQRGGPTGGGRSRDPGRAGGLAVSAPAAGR